MAEVNVNGTGTAMAQTATNAQHYTADGVGTDGKGKGLTGVHDTAPNGGRGLSADLADVVVPGLIRDEYDESVVKCGFSATPMNAMMREMGSKQVKSLSFGFYSIDLRKTEDVLDADVTALTAAQVSPTTPAKVEITVGDNTIFDITDVIAFDGVAGYDAKGKQLAMIDLCALVVGKSGAQKLEVQFINGKEGATIANGTKINILGHAAAEEDASTTPWMALPDPTTQYMQKFMVQSLVSTVFEESTKEVNWTKVDVDEVVMEQLVQDIENFYIFGVRSYTFNPDKRVHTRTCAGVLQQMIEGGSPVVQLYEDDITFADLLEATRQTFEGNTGSNKRYMFCGGKIAPAIWGIKDITKIASVKDFKSFGYEFEGLNLMGYSLVHVPHPLLNKKGKSNYAIVIDRAFLQRAVFRSMKDTQLELTKTGAYDGNSTVWSEISAPILKYPKAHALWILNAGSRPTSGGGTGA